MTNDDKTERHPMPEDPQSNPQQAVDALEERVFGETRDQRREDSGEGSGHTPNIDAEETGDDGGHPPSESPG